jgi:hypothetical protein
MISNHISYHPSVWAERRSTGGCLILPQPSGTQVSMNGKLAKLVLV